ncbi:MAG: hypothetical protein WBW58_06210 [Candidatus Acidiferrum sp.]
MERHKKRNALPDDFHSVIRMLEEKRFPVKGAVSSVVGLDEAPRALFSSSHYPLPFKKILVNLD